MEGRGGRLHIAGASCRWTSARTRNSSGCYRTNRIALLGECGYCESTLTRTNAGNLTSLFPGCNCPLF
jgi:hypothetical protein